MHLGTTALLEFYNRHRDDESLVLVTITGIVGSTYRKPGAMMLIAPDHEYEGMISGGCLEGDLLHHADEVFASGEPKSVTYDMHAGEDLVWGLGIGCDGVIHLLLQRLDPPGDCAMLDWIRSSLEAGDSVLIGLVCRPGETGFSLGDIGLIDAAGRQFGHESLAELCRSHAAETWPGWRYREAEHDGAGAMLINVPPQPRVLLCGAGPDAVPVARQFDALGWHCTVVDHRPAYARPDRFPAGCEVVQTRPPQLQEHVELEGLDAAVIMSHNLDNDADYLRQLAPVSASGGLAYLGVLGPTTRRDRLRDMAECQELPVRGPVGLDIGAELPEGIALSIAAEIHAVLNLRDGLALTGKGRK
ncbi:XdhC family protein [Elongatibacter sediminis]|uniref:XdhC family protein n=1 Tax=Elongatibacter sediminis TaxID=3119006 RepID=A0AAW9R7P9_9GAMM